MLTFFKAQWQFFPLFVVFNWDLEEMYANKKYTVKEQLMVIWKILYIYLVYYIPKNTMVLFLDLITKRGL